MCAITVFPGFINLLLRQIECGILYGFAFDAHTSVGEAPDVPFRQPLAQTSHF